MYNRLERTDHAFDVVLKLVGESDVLSLRYRAWGSSKYSERGTWVVQVLHDCMEEPTVEGGRQKFVTCVGGRRVCKWLFYAVATSYSQRRLKALKADIRERGRFFATHRNTHQTREHIHISATQVVLENYFKEAGCTQPHRQVVRRKDRTTLPLVLLPMNMTRQDVYDMESVEIANLGQNISISKSAFYCIWRTEFPNVQIPPHSRFSKCQIYGGNIKHVCKR